MHRRLRPFLFATALFVLAGPAIALADVPAGAWQITGIVLNGTKIDATGKLSLDNGVHATVGCNSIGGDVTAIDGSTITIGSLSSTLIGCPGAEGTAEDALTKILTAGPITVSPDKWESAAGLIALIPASGSTDGGTGGGAPGCIPPVAPGANPGDVTVPCGNGGSGSGQNGSTTDSTGPLTATDPTMVAAGIGAAILVIATIAAFFYLGPRRMPGGGDE